MNRGRAIVGARAPRIGHSRSNAQALRGMLSSVSVRLGVHVRCATAQSASPTRLAVVVRAARELALLSLKVAASADAICVRTACSRDGTRRRAGGCRRSSWCRLRRGRLLRICGWLLLLITPLWLLVVLSRVWRWCFVFLLATGSEHYCDNSKTQCCD